MFLISAGSCIHLPKPSRTSEEHLWIVINEPTGIPPEAVMVNLTSFREGVDTTVVLDEGDHSFIRHPTVVFYADARIVEISLLERWAALGDNRVHNEICSDELLDKIRAGLFESKYTPRKIKNYCRDKF